MKQTKVFLTTFITAFSIMLCCFAAMYWLVVYPSPQSAANSKEGVPVLNPDYNDSKTTLIVVDFDTADFFFLLKLNALQNKVSLVSIPSAFELSKSQRTVRESMEYAGVMQCVQDISNEFDISVDYHLLCDRVTLDSITASFSPVDIQAIDGIPQSVEEYLFRGSPVVDITALINAAENSAAILDNEVGIKFLNLAVLQLIKSNMQNICDYALEDIKSNSSCLSTNMGAQDIQRVGRIINFLLREDASYEGLVLSDSEDAQEEIDRLLKQ